MRRNLYFLISTLFVFSGLVMCSSARRSTVENGEETAVAFPGAEGFGKYTRGGRGGKIFVVKNLEDSGPGSLREAVEAKGKKMVVFAVSGTIHLKSPLVIGGHTTLAGQTAPGDGICVADHPVKLGGDQIIIRYMRFRMGDRYQGLQGPVPGSGGDDAFGASKRKHILIDHCSMGWSTDEVCSVYGGDSTTLQWNIISEPLNYSYHFEEGDTDWENHGFGGIWGGSHLSAHHNLFIHCVSRNPRFNGARLGAEDELVDYRYNVIYNWGHNTVYGGEAGNYNVVGNYYKYGPNTQPNVRYRIANPSKTDKIPFGKWYIAGNVTDGNDAVTRDNLLGVEMGKGVSEAEKKACLVSIPIPAVALPPKTARQAYEDVLKSAGASYRRDTLDQRLVNDVINRTGRIIDVQGGFAHGTPYEVSQVAWPHLKQAPAPPDTDGDGIPDDWELKNGLDPGNPADAAMANRHAWYTNIELYINSLVK